MLLKAYACGAQTATQSLGKSVVEDCRFGCAEPGACTGRRGQLHGRDVQAVLQALMVHVKQGAVCYVPARPAPAMTTPSVMSCTLARSFPLRCGGHRRWDRSCGHLLRKQALLYPDIVP